MHNFVHNISGRWPSGTTLGRSVRSEIATPRGISQDHTSWNTNPGLAGLGLGSVRNGAWGSKILCTDYARLYSYYAQNYARDYARRRFGPKACEEWCLGLQNVMHGLCTPDFLLCTELCAGLCTEAFQACGRTLDFAPQMGGLVKKS